MLYFLLAAALVALDQFVKLQVMTHIPVGEHVPFLPYLVDLTYVRNTGAAFSIFSEHTWILAGISLVMSVLLGWCLWKGIPFQKPLGRLTVTLLLAGAVGNLIDRAFRGYVVDMFNVLFMDFAVFNVADICIVVGGFAAFAYYVLFASKLEELHETDHNG
ncbi:MAG: signal peptidase II [Oscillospiraceae bacterium]|jgi:signal peptidase II|nr:signal peptidase II [Oscillospiraceae bacterium]MCI9394780.1 signal peptidase II [Oscillospiraceae bacterium]MCI9581705.1 signal peptidase II [Oscillospiraceae bacterium]